MQKTYKNRTGKIVGVLDGEIYRKSVKRSIHLMKIFNGYGVDVDIFNSLKKNGCESIVITEIDTGDVYICPFDTFEQKKILKDFDGPQYFITGKDLIKVNGN